MLTTMPSDPIIEAIFDIRFSSPNRGFSSILLGNFSSAQYKERFPELERLPVSDLPLAIRQTDPNLRFQPEFRLQGHSETLLIGNQIFGFTIQAPYIGGDSFIEKILKLLDDISELNEAVNVHRVAFRYMNLIEFAKGADSDFDQIKFSGTIADFDLTKHNTLVKFEFADEDIKHIIQVRSHATVTNSLTNTTTNGLLLDIDTALSSNLSEFWENTADIVKRLRASERDMFEKIMTKESLARYANDE